MSSSGAAGCRIGRAGKFETEWMRDKTFLLSLSCRGRRDSSPAARGINYDRSWTGTHRSSSSSLGAAHVRVLRSV